MKKRLDVLLFEKGLYNSREKSKQAIEMKRVRVNGQIVDKASFLCEEDADFEVLPFEFVSRGGFKIQKAIETFEIDLKDRVVLDIGASTGGFTDVCLKAGAKKVYCVDTGVGQLVDSIAKDSRVTNFEKTNFLTMKKLIDVDFVCIDVSFVSLKNFAKKLSEDYQTIEVVALIKPQFECGIEYARKHKGVVKDEKVHKKIVADIKATFENFGFVSKGVTTSPIKGGDGNTEFLIWLKN